MAKVTVMEYERVVRFVYGGLAGVLEPGRHPYRRRGTRLERVDLRPRLVPVNGQEMLTADRLDVQGLRDAAPGGHRPRPLRHRHPGPGAGAVPADPGRTARRRRRVRPGVLLAARSQLPSRLRAALRTAAAEVGADVLELTVRDVMLPGDLRRAYADTALAKERGRADLERARAEAAALRSLANTAKLLEDHPALLRLRALQAAEQAGTTLVLHAD